MTKQIRIEEAEYAWLTSQLRPRESYAAAVKRMIAVVAATRAANSIYEAERHEFEPPKREG